MSAGRYILCDFDGENFAPSTEFWQRQAVKHYEAGKRYRMVEEAERSDESHRHYFATLKDMFDTLHERYADRTWARSPDHLRSYALIKTGFCRSKDYACATKAEARRLASAVEDENEYAVVELRGTVVTVHKAKSQSYKAMPEKGEFQRSKQAVLDFVADLIELPADAEQRRAA